MQVLPFLLMALLAADALADGSVRRQAERLRDSALEDPTAWRVLDSLVTEVGARPVGSPAMTRAKDWAIQKLTALGLQSVHAEEFSKENAWFRGDDTAQITAPYSHSLSIMGLGHGVATPSGRRRGRRCRVLRHRGVSPPFPRGSLAGQDCRG